MKKIVLLTCLLFTVALSGCIFGSEPIEADITGDYTSKLESEAVITFDEYEGVDYIIWIVCDDNDNNVEISFDLGNVDSLGTYSLTEYHPYAMFINSNTVPATYYRTYGSSVTPSGSITFSTYTDDRVKGVFNFLAKIYDSTRTVTVDGTFDINVEESTVE